jgi:6-phosphogluconate dehydrogenase
MQLGIVGLGRMGSNIARRLMKDGHQCVVHNRSPGPIDRLVDEGAVGAYSLEELAHNLVPPRAVWVMVPAGVTDAMIDRVAEYLDEGDIVIDGGNSHYPDDIARAEALEPRGIHYVDCGTSGGVWGL